MANEWATNDEQEEEDEKDCDSTKDYAPLPILQGCGKGEHALSPQFFVQISTATPVLMPEA
jgi:hypothetical protein